MGFFTKLRIKMRNKRRLDKATEVIIKNDQL